MLHQIIQEVDEIRYDSAYNPNGAAWGDPDWLGLCFFLGGASAKNGCLIDLNSG